MRSIFFFGGSTENLELEYGRTPATRSHRSKYNADNSAAAPFPVAKCSHYTIVYHDGEYLALRAVGA